MLKKNRLFTPGPTPLLPAAQMAMASYGAHHRTAEFRALFTRVLADVKEFIGTQNDVLVLASSGTGFMEASVSNLTSPGDKVLVLTAGKVWRALDDLGQGFRLRRRHRVTRPTAKRFLSMSRQKLTPETALRSMCRRPRVQPGARHDVKGIAKLVRALGRHVAGRGCYHRIGHDASRRRRLGHRRDHRRIAEGADDSSGAWRIARSASVPGSAWNRRSLRATTSICARNGSRRPRARRLTLRRPSLFAGLGAAFDYVRDMGKGDLARGREALVNNAELCAEMTRAGAKALGLKLFASVRRQRRSLPLLRPDGIDSSMIVKEFRESVRRRRRQRPGRDEGSAVPHRSHWLLRLSRHGWHSAALEQVLRARRRKPSSSGAQCGPHRKCMRRQQAKSLTTKVFKDAGLRLGVDCR